MSKVKPILGGRSDGAGSRSMCPAYRGDRGLARIKLLTLLLFSGVFIPMLAAAASFSSTSHIDGSKTYDTAVTVVLPSGPDPLDRMETDSILRTCAYAIENALIGYGIFVINPRADGDTESQVQALELLESGVHRKRGGSRKLRRKSGNQTPSRADVIVRFALERATEGYDPAVKLTLTADIPELRTKVGPVRMTGKRAGDETEWEYLTRVSRDAAGELVCRLSKVMGSSRSGMVGRFRIILRLPGGLLHDEQEAIRDALVDFLESEAKATKQNVITNLTLDFTLYGLESLRNGWIDGFRHRLGRCLSALPGRVERHLAPEEQIQSDDVLFIMIREVEHR